MSRRFARAPFAQAEYDALTDDDARNRLIFDWWCDDDDRRAYIASLNRVPRAVPSRAAFQLDPAPPLDQPAPQGWGTVFLLSDPAHVRQALTDHAKFSNLPYAALGGGGFLLAQDPPQPGSGAVDWHAAQQAFVRAALDDYPAPGLRRLADLAIDQSALTSLVRREFDLAAFAEQAALRCFGQLFGYAFFDHVLLEGAARATYRALQYIAVGRHFVSEPTLLPAAQQALGQLVARTSQLAQDYGRRARTPLQVGPPRARALPDGVQPWSEVGLGELGRPLLARLGGMASPLNGRDRALVVATLLAGTVGNVQSAVCLLLQSLLNGPDDERRAVRDWPRDDLEAEIARRLQRLPPLPVLPRRTVEPMELAGVDIPAGSDCLLLLEGQPACAHASGASPVWGDVARPDVGTHACLGRALSLPLIAALVQRTLRLPGIAAALDRVTGEELKAERLWGFGCTRYPLVFDRERRRAPQNLIVAMRVKPPVGDNAARLRRVLAAAVPRIEHVLSGFGHVHFAWFEFTDGDAQLVLRTLFDGDFDAYVLHFALQAGDLFDGLFECLDDAPPLPVGEHPNEFVETIRRFNRAPLAGYLYSRQP